MVTNLIKLTLVLFSLSLQAAMPPVTLSSPDNSFKKGATSLFVPKSQATYLGGIKSRIETGNENQLINPSFESIEADDFGWTTSGATVSTSTPSVDGRALQLSLSGLLDINQDIGTSAAAFEGVQMLASVYVKTTLQDVYVCALTNAVESGCTKATGSGKFEQIIIPFIGNATSNGIIIKTTSSTSGTVYIDSAFVGASSPFQNVTGESSVSAKISDTGVVSNESFDFISGNCSVSGTSVYTCTFTTNYFKSTPNCFVTLDNGTVNTLGASLNGASTTTTTMIYATFNTSTGAANARPVMVLCQKTGLDLPGSSKIYSQRQDTFEAIEGDASTFGSTDTAIANFTLTKNTNAGLLSVSSTAANGTKITALKNLELKISATGQAANTGTRVSITKNSTTLTSITPDGLIAQSGFNASLGTTGALNASASISLSAGDIIRVHGNTNLSTIKLTATATEINPTITGSFAGIEKCANDYECTDMFSATITNGNAISNQNISWLSAANWSPAGTLTLTFNTNLKDGTSALSSNMNCWAIPSTQGQRMSVNTISTTQVIFENRANDGTSNSTPTLAYVYCQKGSQDYKPKTAKVATSIGVPTVPNVTTSAIDTFTVSYAGANAGTASATNCTVSPCNIDQIGNAVSTITRIGGGSYNMSLNKTYSSLKCSGSSTQIGVGYIAMSQVACKSCSSVGFGTGAAIDTAGTIYCQGSY